MTMKTLINFITAIALGMSVVWLTGCPTSSDPPPGGGGGGGGDIVLDDPNPPPTVVGTALYCANPNIQTTDVTANYVVDQPDSIPAYNVSRETAGRTSEQPSELRASAGNNLKRLWFPVLP